MGPGRILRSQPSTILVPLVTSAVVLSLGVWAVTRVAQDCVDKRPPGQSRPTGYEGLLVLVVVLGSLVGLLQFAALFFRRQHQALLDVLAAPGSTDLGDAPADVLLRLLGTLLRGGTPDLRDVLLVRDAVLRREDMYTSLSLTGYFKGSNLDSEVVLALMHQLGAGSGRGSFLSPVPSRGEHLDRAGAAPSMSAKAQQMADACSTLSGALALILTPHPAGWYDAGPDAQDATADGAPPTRDAEAVSGGGNGGGGGGPSGRARRRSLFDMAASFIRPQSAARPGTLAPAGESHSAAQIPDLLSLRPGGGSANGGGSSTIVLAPPPQAAHYPADAPTRLPSPAPASPALSFGLGDSAPGLVPLPYVSQASGGMGSQAGSGGVGESVVFEERPVMVAFEDSAQQHGVRRAGFTSMPSAKGRKGSVFDGISGRIRRASLMQALASTDSGSGGLDGGACDGGGGKELSPRVQWGGRDAPLRSGSREGPREGGGGAAGVASAPLGGPSLRSITGALVGGLRRSITGVGQASRRMRDSPPPPPMIEEVERLLALADDWHFDAFRLADVTQGHPLSALGFYLIQRSGLVSRFKMNPVKLARLLRHLEAGYPDNPYHNATHAADVLQTLHAVLHGARLTEHYLDATGLLAAYFAAIVHDYGHPGLTNDFLVATADPLAVRYNDRSPLENHHSAAAFSAMRRPELDALAPLSKAEKAAFRKLVIEMIMATDMKQHFAILGHFNTAHRLAAYKDATAAQATAPPPASTPIASLLHAPSLVASRRVQDVAAQVVSMGPDGGAAAAAVLPAPKPLDDAERSLSLQIAIKAADIGHLGEGLGVHKRWLAALEEEFFRQGDRERQLSLPISPLFDRAKQGVSKSQTGFYDFVALPLAHALAAAFPGAQPLMRCFLANYNHWRTVDGLPPVPGPP